MRFVLGLSLMLLLSACGKKVTESKTSTPGGVQSLEEEFLNLVNDHRSNMGLKSLIRQDIIEEMATSHSRDMAQRRRPFGHLGLSGRCKVIREEMGMGGACGENVAMGQESAQEVFNAWMNSYEHRLLIEGAFTHTGLGKSRSDKGVNYWTQIFLNVD